jgi:hypothetical protein
MTATADARHIYLACRAEYIRAAKRYIGADPDVPVASDGYETDELTLLHRPYIALWYRDGSEPILIASGAPITSPLRPGPNGPIDWLCHLVVGGRNFALHKRDTP